MASRGKAAETSEWEMPVSSPEAARARARAELQAIDESMQLCRIETDPEPDPEQTIVDRVRALTSSAGADRLKVKIYRRKINGGGLEFCRDYSVPEFEAGDLTAVRDEWGPGEYQIRVIGAQGVAMREDVSIAAPRALALQTAAPDHRPSEFAEVARMLAEGQQRILEALSQRPDPTAQMQQTLGLMVTMREAMGLNQPAAHAAPASSPTDMLAGIVGAIRQLREVSAEINPPSAPVDTDNPMAMLPTVLDLVKTAMARRAPTDPGFAPVTLPASLQDNAPQAGQQFAPESAQQTEGEPVGILVLRGLLGQLLALAESAKPVEEGADFIVEKLPDELLGYLELPNWADILCSFAPGCRKHLEWLTAARNRAIEILNEPEPPESENAPR